MIPAIPVLVFFSLCVDAQSVPVIGKIDRLEIANWNTEWFGKTTEGYGPNDDAKQQALVQYVIDRSEIDIWALCEIANKTAFDSLTKNLPQYEAVIADYFPEQKTALLFNKEKFRLISSRLLGKQNKDSFSTFRFPLELCLLPIEDIGIDTLFLILLHLKSNTGSDSAKMAAYNSRKRSSEWLKMYLNTTKKDKFCSVLGDWNDDIDISIFNQLPSPFINLQTQNFPFRFVSKKLSVNGIGTTVSYPATIDHQLISDKLYSRYIFDSCFVWKLDKYIDKFGAECSDHYPVYSLYHTFKSKLRINGLNHDIMVMPNPALSEIKIANCPSGSEVQVFDFCGKLVYRLINYQDEKIDISSFSKGIYWVRVIDKQSIFNLRFLIEE